jgi:hypothetical protein
MAQEINHRCLNAEAWVDAQVSPCGICGGQVAVGQVDDGCLLGC